MCYTVQRLPIERLMGFTCVLDHADSKREKWRWRWRKGTRTRKTPGRESELNMYVLDHVLTTAAAICEHQYHQSRARVMPSL